MALDGFSVSEYFGNKGQGFFIHFHEPGHFFFEMMQLIWPVRGEGQGQHEHGGQRLAAVPDAVEVTEQPGFQNSNNFQSICQKQVLLFGCRKLEQGLSGSG